MAQFLMVSVGVLACWRVVGVVGMQTAATVCISQPKQAQ